MRTALTVVALLVGTLIFGLTVIVAQLLGIPHTPGGIYERCTRNWALWLLKASGVRLVVHGGEGLKPNTPLVFIANHVSWFDIPALIHALPHYGFVAKRELEKIPLFGAAARAVGVIYIDRENRKAALGAYEDAANKIREGQPVLVYPEGTRGDSASLRPFKKGPFVLAIGSGAPIVPVVIHGTIEVNPRGSFRVTPGTVHVHLLEAVTTDGMVYGDRDMLAGRVHNQMAELLRREYGVEPALSRREVRNTDASGAEVAPGLTV